MKNVKTYVLAMLVIAITSCTHDDSAELEDAVVAAKNNSPNTSIVQMPIVENGILFFTDKNHINEYYEYLSDMVSEQQEIPSTTNIPTSVATILDQFETQFSGFTSYRKMFNQLHDFENQGHSKQELLAIFEETYVKGFEKSYFNTNFELGIGNKVYVYHSKDIVLAFDKNRQDILNEIRAIQKGTGIIPMALLTAYDNDVEFISDIFEIGTKMHLTVNENLSYDSVPKLANINCDVFTKGIGMTLYENIMNDEGRIESNQYLPAFIWITIIWGDDTTNTTTWNTTHSSELLWHTYTDIGTYTAYVSIKFQDAEGNIQVMSDPKVIKVGPACSDENGTVIEAVNDSNWLMIGELSVSNGAFGASKIEGTTFAFKSCGADCWTVERRRRRKPYNKVYISGKFGNENCDVLEHKEGTSISNHANTKREVKRKFWDNYEHSNGDVYSEHRLIKDDTSLSLDLVFNPC